MTAEPQRQAEGNVRKTLLSVISAYRARVGAALLFLLLANVATVAVLLILEQIIDDLSRHGQIQNLPYYLLAGYAVLRFLVTLFSGQSSIIAVGAAPVMLLECYGVAAGRMTVGDLVLVNAYLIQIFLPLNALGFVTARRGTRSSTPRNCLNY